jgi:cytochrome b561
MIPRYSTGAIILHWLTAAALIFQIAFAGNLEGPLGPDKADAFQWHKSVGILVLALTLVRLIWRVTHPAPAQSASLASWERTLAKVTHWMFYGVLLLIPLTGWAAISASPLALPARLFGAIPFPDLPAPDQAFELLGSVHHLLVFGLYGLLALHVAGALKHQLLPRDEAVLGRVAPGARHGWKEPRLWIIAAIAAAIFICGTLIRP